jgi:hypothetical protein
MVARVVQHSNIAAPMSLMGQFRTRAPHQLAMGSRSWNAVVSFAVIGPGSPSA